MEKLDKKLLRAIADGYTQKVEALIIKGANPNCISDFNYKQVVKGATPLIAAALSNNVEVIDLLVKYNVDLDYEMGRGGGALDNAISKQYEEAAIAIINHGANINGVSERHRPINMAIARDTDAVFDLLLKKGADINYPIVSHSYSDFTALQQACSINRFDYAKALIQHGADVNIMNDDEEEGTALHIICNKMIGESSAEVVEALLNYNADPNMKNSGGYTPLEYALQGYDEHDLEERQFYSHVIQLLLEHGAIITERAIEIAKEAQNGVLEFLIAYQENVRLKKTISIENNKVFCEQLSF